MDSPRLAWCLLCTAVSADLGCEPENDLMCRTAEMSSDDMLTQSKRLKNYEAPISTFTQAETTGRTRAESILAQHRAFFHGEQNPR